MQLLCIFEYEFTAIIESGENGWFVGQIEEITAAISQGETIEELRGNLLDALKLVLDANKELTEKEYSGKTYIREELEFI